ncbi:hypothetical protein [Endozoicomonas sp.]|uniref:hypothetical protein n=1 Tax=Endozoicomonas sp. TaxID=1892382 RepID=UPI003AF914B9
MKLTYESVIKLRENPAGNHDDLKGYDYFSDAVIEEAKVSPIQPRPRQVPLRDTRLWGMQADKVYVPLIGPNTEIEGNRATFTLFGLNEFKMENFARQRYRDAQDEKAFYGLVSPDDSCSGVILNTLRHGGADYYTKTDDALLVTDPNLLHKISIRLHNRIDDLNRKAEFLSSQLILLSRSESSGFPGKNSTDKSLQLKSAVDHLKQTIRSSKTPNKVRDHLQRVRACLKDFNNAKCSLDDLTPKAIKFVEALYKSCDSFKDVEQHLLMFKPALEAFEVIKELVTEACSEESFNRTVSDIPIISF